MPNRGVDFSTVENKCEVCWWPAELLPCSLFATWIGPDVTNKITVCDICGGLSDMEIWARYKESQYKGATKDRFFWWTPNYDTKISIYPSGASGWIISDTLGDHWICYDDDRLAFDYPEKWPAGIKHAVRLVHDSFQARLQILLQQYPDLSTSSKSPIHLSRAARSLRL